jgi:UDP-GlcNAc:undecaprenyl-phosphate GlcNAc-1-phosphate transferase
MLVQWQIASVVAFVATLVLIHLARPVAIRIGLVDVPKGHKNHDGEVPLIGGIAMFCGFLFAALVLDIALGGYRSFFAAVGLLVVIGVLDDFHELSSRARLIVQIIAALLMSMWGGVILHDFGDLSFVGVIELGMFAVPVTVFCTVGVINAVNMSDGLDGLAGGLSSITLAAMAYLAWLSDRLDDVFVLLVLLAAVIGFLVMNVRTPWRKRAGVFMGDAGSMFLGFALVWFLIGLSQGAHRAYTPVTALWIFALPLLDTGCIMLRRIAKGQSPFQADREHFHHILQLAGFSVAQSVAMMWGVAALFAIIGIAGYQLGVAEGVMFYAFLALAGCYYWGMTHAWRVMKQVRRLHEA